jgi:hypothetical protein
MRTASGRAMSDKQQETMSEDAWQFVHRGHKSFRATVEGPSTKGEPLQMEVLVCEACDTMLVLDVRRKGQG